MRSSDIFYRAALVVLLGWLVLMSVIDADRLRSPLANPNLGESLPDVSASSERPRQLPQPLATATVDERIFRIFVAGNSKVWSVAVSED